MTAHSMSLNGAPAVTVQELLQARPAGAILRFEEAKLWESGQAFMREASRILDHARHEAAAQFSDARETGYRSGYEEGVKDALALILKTKAAVDDYRKELQVTLTDVVVDLLKQIMDDMQPGAAVAAAVRKALPTLDLGGEVTLVVCPEVANEVAQYLSAHLDSASIAKLAIREDARLRPTECRIESSFGSVDLSLGNQLELLAASLRSARIGIEG